MNVIDEFMNKRVWKRTSGRTQREVNIVQRFGRKETTTETEMPLSEALRKAKREFGPHFPVWAIRRAVAEGTIPSRRSSLKSGARYYVRWATLVMYWQDLKTQDRAAYLET